MAHVPLPPGRPGIEALLAARPDTAGPLLMLADILLRPPAESSFSPAERELVAAVVSTRNGCRFCSQSHAAVARLLWGEQSDVVNSILLDADTSPITPRLRALLSIADAVAVGGQQVSAELVAGARDAGATDEEVHDTVLIAAAFCMFNRYVDGLATPLPNDPVIYDAMAARLVANGYRRPAAASHPLEGVSAASGDGPGNEERLPVSR